MNPPEPNPPTTPVPTARSGKSGWFWFLAIAVVVIAWAGAFALRGGDEDVELDGWSHGLDEGKARAQEQDRPMVVLFTATWCGPCQLLKQKVLNQPEVASALQAGFVPVKVDMSDARMDDPLIKQYDLRGWPTLIAMTPEGKEIKRIEGLTKSAQSPESFNDWLASIKE